MRVFSSLARAIARRPVTVIVSWAVAAAALLATALVGVGGYGNIDHRTETGPPLVPGSDAYLVYEHLTSRDTGETYELFGQVLGAASDDVATLSTVNDALAALADTDHVRAVVTPFTTIPGAAFDPAEATGEPIPGHALDNQQEDGFLIVVTTDGLADEEHEAVVAAVEEGLAGVWDAIAADEPEAEFYIFSLDAFIEAFSSQIEQDLILGEAIALPLALIVMVFVFGGFLAASTPIIGALASIAGGMAVLYAFTFPFDVDDAALNVVTVLGIGLSIDYGLLIVSRFREELARRRVESPGTDQRTPALVASLQTAGRTVFFSAITVAVSVLGMMTFSPDIMRAFGGAGIGVVVMALATALTLVPAVMFLYGERLVKPGPLSRLRGVRAVLRRTSDVEADEGAFSRLAAWVQRRPWMVLTAVSAILIVLASPVLGLTMRNSEIEILPASDPARQYLEEFDGRYPALAEPEIELLAPVSPEYFDAWLTKVAAIEGVERVSAASVSGEYSFAGVYVDAEDAAGQEVVDVVTAIRDLESPFPVYAGGQAANQSDFVAAIVDGLPVALLLVVGATFVLLFLMTGSLLVPVKTLIINSLSLAASLGVVVWIFQLGNLESVLGFTSAGGVESYVVVLLISFGFGLAMDYEVFLLARIKELVDRGVANDDAVRLGLQRSGRIITSAALIIILVFLGFAAGKVLVIKELGVGLAFAVLLDATLVRMLLVPATMTLLGQWNWWAPKPLRAFYDRFAITH